MPRRISGRVKKSQRPTPAPKQEDEDHQSKLMKLIVDMKRQASLKHLKAKQVRAQRLKD